MLMSSLRTVTLTIILTHGISVTAMIETTKLTTGQMHLSYLEREILKLENNLQDLVKNKTGATEQRALQAKIQELKKKKLAEDRLNRYRDELGGLETALHTNREILLQLNDKLEELKKMEGKSSSSNREVFILEKIKKQRKNIEQQMRKLKEVLGKLERKETDTQLKIAGENQKAR